MTNILENQGTSGQNSGLSNLGPQSQVDLESADAEKWFAEAFNKNLGIESPKTEVVLPPEVKAPESNSPAAEVMKAEVVKTEQIPDASQTVKAPEASSAKDGEKQEQKSTSIYNVPDWAKDLAPDVQKLVAQELAEKFDLRHRANSDRGRVSSLNQKLLQLEREVAAYRAATQNPKPQDPQLAAAAKQDATNTLAEWNTLIEADPNLAKAFQGKMTYEKQELQTRIQALEAKLEATVNPLYQHAENNVKETERQLLMEAVPNYAEVIQSPEYDRWINRWAGEGVKNLAFNSIDHRDAIRVMQMFALDGPAVHDELIREGVVKRAPEAAQTVPATVNQTTQSATTNTVDTAAADKVAKSREQKSQSPAVISQQPNPMAASASSNLATSRPGDSIDLENEATLAYFEEAFKKAMKR